MFNLEELTDVEMEEYLVQSIGGTEEYNEKEKRDVICKAFRRAAAEEQKIGNDLKNAEFSLNDLNYSKTVFWLKCVTKKTEHFLYSVRKLILEMGDSEDIYLDDETSIQIVGERQDDILHLILPCLLPDKVKQGESSRYNEIIHAYLPAFRNFFSHGRFPVYERKAVLVFLNYYDSEQHLKDHDNFETKQIIDILAAFLLPDDNPKWCAHFMDYRMGDSCHTEIYVVPYSKFTGFLESL